MSYPYDHNNEPFADAVNTRPDAARVTVLDANDTPADVRNSSPVTFPFESCTTGASLEPANG